MGRQPLLSSIDLWAVHERLCSDLLRRALEALADRSPLANENDLNRDLYRAIIRLSHAAAQTGELVPPVVPEGRNPPSATDQERAEREFKRPDFYWAYIDPLVDDPNDASKQFVVECKRLTNPTGHYTQEYVRSGVARFVTPRHGYGMGMRSGAIAGYLQEVFLGEALIRVNDVARSNSIPPLILRRREGETTAQLHHDVSRPFPQSPFRLIHIWSRVGPSPDP